MKISHYTVPKLVSAIDAVNDAERAYRDHLSACADCVWHPLYPTLHHCRIGIIYANTLRTAFRWGHK